MNKRHTVEKISTLLFLLLSLAVLAGFIPVRLGMLSGVAEKILRDEGADSVSVGSVTAALWTGLRVYDLDTYKRVSDTGDYRVRAHHVDISCNLLRLGVVMLAVPKPTGRDIFLEIYENPLGVIRELGAGDNAFHPADKIALRGAGINFTDKGKPGISADGVSANISRRAAGRGHRHKSTYDGDLHVGKAIVPSLAKIENFHVKLRTCGDKLDLVDGYGSIFGGKISADLSLCLKDAHVLSGAARIKGLDLEKFCKVTGFSPGRMTGKVNAEAVIDFGSHAAIDSIRAKGSLSVTRLTAEGIALQKVPAVNQVLGNVKIMPFSEVRGDFEIADLRVNFSELVGVGDVMKFRSVGWIGFDGRLSHDFNGEFTQQFVAGLPRIIRNGLEPAEGGGGRFRCRITGTFERPRVEVDRSVYNRAIRNFFR